MVVPDARAAEVSPREVLECTLGAVREDEQCILFRSPTSIADTRRASRTPAHSDVRKRLDDRVRR